MTNTIIVHGFDLTDDVQEYVDKKLKKLDKYFSGDVEARTVLKREKSSFKTEITLTVGTDIYRGECSYHGDKLFDTITTAVSNIEGQIRKYKTLLKKQKRQNIILPVEEVIEDEKEFPIVREKNVKLKPMSSDEAVLQMHMTNHSWYVYLDADTNKVSVVYFRQNGGYGIMRIDDI